MAPIISYKRVISEQISASIPRIKKTLRNLASETMAGRNAHGEGWAFGLPYLARNFDWAKLLDFVKSSLMTRLRWCWLWIQASSVG